MHIFPFTYTAIIGLCVGDEVPIDTPAPALGTAISNTSSNTIYTHNDREVFFFFCFARGILVMVERISFFFVSSRIFLYLILYHP